MIDCLFQNVCRHRVRRVDFPFTNVRCRTPVHGMVPRFLESQGNRYRVVKHS